MTVLLLILMLICVPTAVAQVPTYEKGGDVPSTMVVVAPKTFEGTLQPFIQWKRLIGYHIVEQYADSNDSQHIRQQLSDLYHSGTLLHPPHQYVLIVGDVEHIEAFRGNYRLSADYDNHPTDLYYGEYTGDTYPEAIVGRLSVSDTAELRSVLTKSMKYEQMRYDSTEWLNRILLVAGREGQPPAPTATNGQVNYIGQQAMLRLAEADTHCYRNPASAGQTENIMADIEQGNALVCYTAHGDVDGWLAPTINRTKIDSLKDTTAAVYINTCCLSSKYDYDCFGERLLRKPKGGAVAVIGAANSTLWREDYLATVGARTPMVEHPTYNPGTPGIADLLFDAEGKRGSTLGDLLRTVYDALRQFESPYTSYYAEIYNLMGDPTLIPYMGQPREMQLMVEETPRKGDCQLTVRAMPNTRIAISEEGDLLAVGHTDTTGHALLHLAHSITSDSITLVATAKFHRPYIQTMATEEATALAIIAHEYSNDTLNVEIANLGHEMVRDHKIVLEQKASDRENGAHIQRYETTLRDMEPDERHTVAIPINIVELGAGPYWSATITLKSDNHDYTTLPLAYDYATEYPALVAVNILHTDGSRAERLRRGETYLPQITVANHGTHTATLVVSAYGDSTLHTIEGRDSISLTMGACTIPCDSQYLHLSTRLEYGQYQSSEEHYLPAGKMSEGFESGSFGRLPWDNTSLQGWSIDSTVAHTGRYAARSGKIDHDQRTHLRLWVTLVESDTLTFYAKTSSEEDCDKLLFYVDGNWQKTWSGTHGWHKVQHVLEEGRHLLQWTYSKDSYGTRGDDAAYLDDIQLPLARWDCPAGEVDTTAWVAIATVRTDTTIGIDLYPNPANSEITVATEGIVGSSTIAILDPMGRTISSKTVDMVSPGRNTLRLKELPTGIYYISIKNDSHTYMRKIIIQRQ